MSKQSAERRRRKILRGFLITCACIFALAGGSPFRAEFTWDEYALIAVLSALALVLGWVLEWRRTARDERADARSTARDTARMERAEAEIADLSMRVRVMELNAAHEAGRREALAEVAPDTEGEGE